MHPAEVKPETKQDIKEELTEEQKYDLESLYGTDDEEFDYTEEIEI
jgi:hypothetical protein